jgi:hypothetical protein
VKGVGTVKAAVIRGLNLSSKKTRMLARSKPMAVHINLHRQTEALQSCGKTSGDLHRLTRELGPREENCRNVLCMATWTSISGRHSVVHKVLQRLPEAACYPNDCMLHLSA